MRFGYKLINEMNGKDEDFMEEMAHEQARFILEHGPYVTDSRGVRTYFKVSDVHKVKVVPPGVELEATTHGKEEDSSEA